MHSDWAELQPGGAVVGSREVGELYVAFIASAAKVSIATQASWLVTPL